LKDALEQTLSAASFSAATTPLPPEWSNKSSAMQNLQKVIEVLSSVKEYERDLQQQKCGKNPEKKRGRVR
jgi:hypothetical protein